LTRRKEMMVWIALPLAMSLISLFSFQSSGTIATSTVNKLTPFWGPLIGVFLLAFYMALTGIGQEGSAFLNLRIIPLKEQEVTKSKLAVALLPSTAILIVVIAVIPIIVQLRLEAFITVAVTLFAALFECAFVGLAVGSRFPDFTELPRARFVDPVGTLVGMLIVAVCVGITFLPPFVYSFHILGFPILLAPVLSAIVCVVVCYASYHAILGSLQKLTHQVEG
jgi:hypothetical protein